MIDLKVCSKCGKEKSTNNFHFKKTENRFHSWCKSCLYGFQKERWISRKKEAIELLGNKCCQCGYHKNTNALQFHHLDPNQKEFDWSHLRLRNWENIILELKKCILVCANCHSEIHYPEQTNCKNSNNILNSENSRIAPTGKCPTCESDVYGTKYCSTKCAGTGCRRAKERPSKEDLLKMLSTSSFVAVGRKYGVSDNAVRKWLKAY